MTERSGSRIDLPMEVEYQPAWLTWVASTTTCLRALGVDCDQADVAGFSGYAFHLCVHEQLCPSAPTMLDWAQLTHGVHALGRATVEFYSPCCGDSSECREESCHAVFDLIRNELLAGRPSVLWGTYVPEFGVAVGIENEAYLVKCFREIIGEEQPPIPYLDTATPGGVYALSFPARTQYGDLQRDLEAILRALRWWNRPAYGVYQYGKAAYDLWIDALQAGNAERFGFGYNAACYAEGRRYAQQFFLRMSHRRPLASELLRKASDCYSKAAEAVKCVSEMFPFGHDEEGPITDKGKIEEAVVHLGQARSAEVEAVTHLTDITKIQVRRPDDSN